MDLTTSRAVPTSDTNRAAMLATAQRLAIFTIVWNVTEGVVAITAAWVANSRALTGFGLDSAIESISASVLLWRLLVERRNPDRAERVEHVATRAIGVSFFVLAAFVAYDAINSLAAHDRPHTSIVGIAVTTTSLIVMPILARRKKRVAVALGSRAAEADSKQTWACVWLSAVVLAGLLLNALLDWWWADPVAALGVVIFLIIEGRAALSADGLDDCC